MTSGAGPSKPEATASDDLHETYRLRFSDRDAETKDTVWQTITAWLQRWVDPGGDVLDIACDRGHFINNVAAGRKVASDLRDVSLHLSANVEFHHASGLDLAAILPLSSFDVVFMSNYLEHLPSGEAVVEQLRVAHALLRPGGRVIILQPNVRLLGGAYWDFIDHKTALTEKSLAEAVGLAGLSTEKVIVRFLPFTTKSRLPSHPLLVRAYLAFRPAWLLLGKQTLFIARRDADTVSPGSGPGRPSASPR